MLSDLNNEHMNTLKFAKIASIASFSALTNLAIGAVAITDDFSYSDGALAGNNGGIGWAGAWSNHAGIAPTVVGGEAQLSYTGTGVFIRSNAQRELDTEFGDEGTDVLIQFTAQKTATHGVAESFGGLRLFDSASNNSKLIGNFWPGDAVDTWGINDQNSTTDLVTVETNVVVRITYGAGDSDTAEFFLNPSDINNLGTADLTDTANYAFDTIRLESGSNNGTETWRFDDISITSQTVPEPSTLLPLAFGVLSLTGRRKRK